MRVTTQSAAEPTEKSLMTGWVGSEICYGWHHYIEHHLEYQEYPRISEDGIAYVYNVSELDESKTKQMFSLKNLQYAVDGRSGTKYEFECEFLGVKATKNIRTCQGIKMCTYTSEELNSSHTFVDFENNIYKNILILMKLQWINIHSGILLFYIYTVYIY